jgi:hypothetical protein
MKTQIKQSRGDQGNVLLISLITAMIIGATLGSFLLLVRSQSTMVVRSQVWNETVIVTEAGVEDALQLINKHAGTPNLSGWTNEATSDGWTALSANVFHVRRYIGNSSAFYDAYVTNYDTGPDIYTVGFVPPPALLAFAPQTFFAAAGVTDNGPRQVSRKLSVQTLKDPMFNFALAAEKTIDLKGNNVATDSFDSSNTNYSNADGSYNPAKNKDGGDVVSNDTITNTINVGNADIMGRARTGPNGTVKVGPNGSVGSKAWVTGGNNGKIQPGWSSSDMNVKFPNVPSPDTIYTATWYTIAPATFTTSDYYKFTSLSGNVRIGTNANVVIWVTGNASFSGGNEIKISPGASLTIYMGGSFSISGNATINNVLKDASKFTLLGLPTCTSIDMRGNGAISGVIYAPQAALSFGGGGSDTYDLVGSAMARTVTMNGHMNFHYDEALKNKGFSRGYIPSGWKEAY